MSAFQRGVALVPSLARMVQLTGAQDLRNLEASGELRLEDLLVTASDGIFDRLVADGDDSGTRTFAAWSPAAALSYRLGGALLFASFSTAFETPTTTELVNRPDRAGGFNPDLAPQRARGVEAGARGAWVAARLLYDVAVFRMDVTDRLTPFQAADSDRTFYRNSGENVHLGVEAALEWLATRDLRVLLTYTGSRFTYRDGALAGNRLPGIPDHRLVASLEATRAGLRLRLDGEAVAGFYVDDENTEQNDGYVLFDVNLGHAGLPAGSARLQPFVAVRNLLGTAYVSSVIVNARLGRFYEPAPGRTFQAGLGLAF